MKRIRGVLNKDLGSFTRFAIVGVIWTAINICTDVLLVDHWHLSGWLGTLIGYVALYVGRYYSYLLLKVIRPQFWKYVSATVIFTLVIWLVKSAAMDIFHYPAIQASPIITGLSFMAKYIFYRRIKLIRSDADSK